MALFLVENNTDLKTFYHSPSKVKHIYNILN